MRNWQVGMKMMGDWSPSFAGMTSEDCDKVQMLKWLNWAVLGLLAFVLIFTRQMIDAFGMENTLQSVLILVAPLMIAAIGIEGLSRYLAK